MMRSSYKKQFSNLLTSSLAGNAEHVSVYLLGSLRGSADGTFDERLSDVDLLVVPDCDSLDCYVGHFEQLINLSKSIDYERIVEFFFLSSKIVDLHFGILSVIAGTDGLSKRDLILGRHIAQSEQKGTNEQLRLLLYKAHAVYFYEEYIRKAPFTDTGKARQVAKRFLRAYKILSCANAESIGSMERELYTVNSFAELSDVVKKYSFDPLFDRLLKGDNVDDWAYWMDVQNAAAHEIEQALLQNRVVPLHRSLCRIYTLLMINLKNILSTPVTDEAMRDFIHEAISACTSVALAGVEKVADLSRENVKIKESFDIIESFLQDGRVSLRVLAASVVLLEHAFLMGVEGAEAEIKNNVI